MKITKVECIPVSIPFVKPIIMSGGPVTQADGVVLKLHTDEGITGVSETGDTSLWYMGESQDSIMYNLTKVFAPQMLIGEDPFNIETIVAKMDKATRANNHSKSVVDYALHDLMGKALGVPVYKLLGGLSNPKIALAFVMSSGSAEEVGAEGQALVAAGFQGLKLKVGAHAPEEDIEMIGALREAVGSKVKVMIDANGGWMYHQALYVLQRIAKYDVYLCEQPVPWWDIDGLARLRRKVDVPIFADESAAELGHLLQILEKDAADGFFLKIPKAGGILESETVGHGGPIRQHAGDVRLHGQLRPGQRGGGGLPGRDGLDGQDRAGSHRPAQPLQHLRHGERTHRERSGQEGPALREGFPVSARRGGAGRGVERGIGQEAGHTGQAAGGHRQVAGDNLSEFLAWG